jgi:hypothetical protein
MHDDYPYLHDPALKPIRGIQRRNLAYLATQAASFCQLQVPLSIKNQLEAAKAASDTINRELARRRIQSSDAAPGHTISKLSSSP